MCIISKCRKENKKPSIVFYCTYNSKKNTIVQTSEEEFQLPVWENEA